MKVEFCKHNLDKIDKEEAMKVLDSLFLTSGNVLREFESFLAEYLGSKYAVGLTSCTNALELSLKYFNLGPGDEVITTPMSFVATANAVEYCGAKPVFVDVEFETGNIDANLIRSAITNKTKAILVVHLYGQMCDMITIRKIADEHNLVIIEDAAHCLEGKRNSVGVGELSEVACFSFYATKNITSGEGGALICNKEEMYDWFLRARLHGMSKSAALRYTNKYEHYDVSFLGLKCNMSDIQAALLKNQMKRVNSLLLKREKIWAMYDKYFLDNKFIRVLKVLPDVRHARHLYTILVNPEWRDYYLHAIQERFVGVAVNFRPIHLMTYYRKKYGYSIGDFPNAEEIGSSTISIPFYPKLTLDEIEYVVKVINEIVNK